MPLSGEVGPAARMTANAAEHVFAPLPSDASLDAIVEDCDLAVDLGAGEHAGDVGALLDTLSQQFLDYRIVVAGVHDAVRRNAEMLGAIASAAVERDALTGATAEAIAAAGRGSRKMVDDAEVLGGFSQSAGDAVNSAAGNLESIDGALGELSVRLAQTDSPLTILIGATDGVGEFVSTLARHSRQAQMLGINASIEAAYLGEAGARLAIVASEVRKLSSSTHESKADVAKVVAELREASRQIVDAIAECQTATAKATRAIISAGEALGEMASGIEQFEGVMTNYQAAGDAQSAALEVVGSSIEEIVRHAGEAARASRDAEHLNLDVLLERAQERAGRWKLRPPSQAPAPSDTEFGRWIGSICAGADAALPARIDDCADMKPLVAQVRSIVESVNAEQREILADVVKVAVAISLNGYAWQAISAAFDGVAHGIAGAREKVAQWVKGALDSVEFATEMRTVIVDSISDQCGAALDMLERALTLITRIDEAVRTTDGSVELLNAAAARGKQLMALIDDVSSETDLLSVNAAIEAAHTGSLGFGVIADAIGSLARSTLDSTTSVSELVSSIVQKSAEFEESVAAASKSMKNLVRSAVDARGGIYTFHSAFKTAIDNAAALASIASEQKRALDSVSEYMDRCAGPVADAAEGRTAKGRLELAIFGSRAHAIAARRTIGTVIERLRVFAESLCVKLETVLEAALVAGDVSPDDLFSFTYRGIGGEDIASLERLFDVSRVPPSGFMPPKYATSWDAAVDEPLIGVLTQGWDDATTAGFAPVSIGVSDLNGFLYAVPRQGLADWTNTPENDDVSNRIKRLFEDEYAFRVGRWGLGPDVAALGPRCTYEQFQNAGCALDRPSPRAWGAYVYARDPQLVCNELAMGIYVRGMRHSTLRLCYDQKLL